MQCVCSTDRFRNWAISMYNLILETFTGHFGTDVLDVTPTNRINIELETFQGQEHIVVTRD